MNLPTETTEEIKQNKDKDKKMKPTNINRRSEKKGKKHTSTDKYRVPALEENLWQEKSRSTIKPPQPGKIKPKATTLQEWDWSISQRLCTDSNRVSYIFFHISFI